MEKANIVGAIAGVINSSFVRSHPKADLHKCCVVFLLLSNFLDFRSLYPSEHWAQIRAENIVSHGINYPGNQRSFRCSDVIKFYQHFIKTEFCMNIEHIQASLEARLDFECPHMAKKKL